MTGSQRDAQKKNTFRFLGSAQDYGEWNLCCSALWITVLSNIYHSWLPSTWDPHKSFHHCLWFQWVYLPEINNTTTERRFTYNFCRTEEFWVYFHMDHPCLRATANLLVILAFPPGIEQEEMELQHCLHIHSIISSVLFVFFLAHCFDSSYQFWHTWGMSIMPVKYFWISKVYLIWRLLI